MKLALVTASLLLATSVSAQETETAVEETVETKAAAFTIDTPIADLMADERAKAVVDKHIPGIEAHPAYEQIKGFSLPMVQPFSEGAITDEMLAAIAADLAELG